MGAAEGRGTPRRAPDVIPVTRENAGDGELHARRAQRGTPAAHAAARPDRTPADRATTERKEEAGLVTDQRLGAGLVRDVPLLQRDRCRPRSRHSVKSRNPTSSACPRC